MDRNQVTGLILISLLLFAYYYFFAPTSQPVEPEEPVEIIQNEPVLSAQDSTIKEEPLRADVPKETGAAPTGQLGPFSILLNGEEKEIDIENDVVRYTFSTRGGSVKKVLLKNFTTYDKQPLILVDENSSTVTEEINTNYGTVDLNRIFYSVDYTNNSVSGDDTVRLTFTASLSNGDKVIKNYRIPGEGYTLIQDISLRDIRDEMVQNTLLFSWRNNLKKFEKDMKTSQMKATINYYTEAGDFDDLSETSTDFEEEVISEPVKWMSFKQKFFTSAIIGNEAFRSAYVSLDPNQPNPATVKSCLIRSEIPVDDFEKGYHYYYGPNNYQILKKVEEGFARNIYLGWTPVNWVNKFLIIPTFQFLERFLSNYGLIIILLVVFIKILLFPLTYKSYISMAKTKVLKPELDAIKERLEGDMQKVQSEQMKLYQQVGVNPLSGCIPILLQMPILFSMFYFFPNSIELRQESFLWADDLSTFDSIMSLPFSIPAYGDHVSLFTLLMTASTILYTWSNNQVTTVQGPMKSMQYFMPVVFMFVLNSFPAALSFYYFVSNIVTFGQQALIRKFVDDEKIKAILDENRKKSATKKKSKFQMKLEEAMKAGEETKKRKKK